MSESVTVIGIGVDLLSASFFKKISDEQKRFWIDTFCNYDELALSQAFKWISNNDDKFPSPRRFREVLRGFLYTSGAPRIIRSGVDNQGIPCVYWSDEPDVPAYMAKDSPGGREFLKLMAQWHLSQPEKKGKRRERKGSE